MKKAANTLLFNGNAAEAFNLYKKVFNLEFKELLHMKDMPNAKEMNPQEANKILQVQLELINLTLTGMDIPQSKSAVSTGDNFMINIEAESLKETCELFDRLAQDGKISTPLTHADWGAFFGIVTDQFGIKWMLSFKENDGNS